ncbi:MAG: hypothetical protein R3E66_17685 [bacterium]
MFKPLVVARSFLHELLSEGEELGQPPSLWYLAELIKDEDRGPFANIPTNELPDGFEPITASQTELFASDYGTGHRIDDPEVIADLWALRSSYLAKSENEWWYGYIPFTNSDGQLIQMKFRRSLPELEDDRGFVPPFVENPYLDNL